MDLKKHEKDLLVFSNANKERQEFVERYEVVDKILKGEFQSEMDAERKRRIKIINDEIDTLSQRTESNIPFQIIEHKTGSLIKTNLMPEVSLYETKKPETEAKINKFLAWQMTSKSFNVEMQKAVRNAYAYGIGVIRTQYDPFVYAPYKKTGDVVMESISPLRVFLDPNARNIQESYFFMDVRYAYSDAVLDTLSEEELQIFQDAKDNYPDYNLNVLYNNMGVVKKPGWSIITDMYIREKVKKEVKLFRIMFIDDVAVRKTEIKSKLIPYTVLHTKMIQDNPYGHSLVMQMYNAYLMHLVAKDAINMNLIYATNPQFEYNSQQMQVDMKTFGALANMPGQVFSSRSGQAIRMLDRNKFTQEMQNMYVISTNEMYETAGLNKTNMGQSSGSLTTSGGVYALLDSAEASSATDINLYTEFIRNVTICLLEEYRANGEEIRFTSKGSEISKDIIKFKDIIGEIDVNVDVITSNVNDQQSMQLLLSFWQQAMQYGDQLPLEFREQLTYTAMEYLPLKYQDKFRMEEGIIKGMQKKNEDNAKASAMAGAQALQMGVLEQMIKSTGTTTY